MFLIAVMLALAAAAVWPAAADAARCSLSVNGDIEYNATTPGGLPRSNPDGTVYPGDAFLYSFEYRFSGGCIGPRVHGVASHGAAFDASGNGPGRVGRSGSVDGTGEILIAESLECVAGWPDGAEVGTCGYLSMEISARERRCSTGSDGTKRCWYVTKRDSDSVYPTVRAPHARVLFEDRVLLDPDGYNSTNMDGTNYVWDPIAVHHSMEFEWRDERSGTISFLHDRTFAPLAEESGAECDSPCAETLIPPPSPVGTGFLPHEFEAGNGGGLYAYAAPSLGAAGLREMTYNATILNIGRPIGWAENSTSRLVADYEPSYACYPYTVFSDGRQWAYDDGQGVAMRYSGSNGTGPDDVPVLHPDRRSKLNAFDAGMTFVTEFPGNGIPIPDGMRWISAAGPPGVTNGTFHSLGEHAVFYGAGHGTVRYGQNVTDALNATDLPYANATTANILLSNAWAGYISTELCSYEYRYPYTPFARWFNVTADVPLALSAATGAPADILKLNETGIFDAAEFDPKGFADVMLADYLYAKALRDTDDAAIAAIVRADSHSMENNAAGVGGLQMWTNRTVLTISGTAAAMEGYDRSMSGILDMPRHAVLGLPSMLTVDVTAGSAVRPVSIHSDVTEDYVERIVMNPGPVEHERDGPRGNSPVVLFRTSEGFGPLREVRANGVPVSFHGSMCSGWCSADAGTAAAEVTVINWYGGTARFSVNATDSSGPEPAEWISEEVQHMFITIVAISAIAYMAAKALKRIKPE